MCGRFNVTSDPLNQLIATITGRGFVVESRYNIAPTEDVPVLRKNRAGEWDMRDMRWWLVPYWSDGPSSKYSMFNAKSETLTRSRAYREPFERRRCLIPASGYYEWRKEGSIKVPYYITPGSNTGFVFAGLWDRWKGELKGEETVVESCTIVTTNAPAAMKEIHERIPAHLTMDQVGTWMSPDAEREELMALLAPDLRTPLAITPVSTYVNNSRNKDARCVEPLAEARIVH